MSYDTNDSVSMYPSRSAQQTSQLENKFDYDYGLDRQWNYNSQTMTMGKQLPKLPAKNYGSTDGMELSTSTLLPNAIPIASGGTKRTRQLPQPIGRKRLPRNGQARMLPQMPSTTKTSYRTSMGRSDKDYSGNGCIIHFNLNAFYFWCF